MRLAEHYDVICAGGGLSSYLCAALLARAGKRVLVVDEGAEAMARLRGRSDDFPRLLFDPDFAVFTGIDETTAFGKTVKELGLGDKFHRPDSIMQVLTADYRIRFAKDAQATKREVLREMPASGRAVCGFFELLQRAGVEVPGFVNFALTPAQGSFGDSGEWKKFWGKYYSSIQSKRPVALEDVLEPETAEVCEGLGAAILGALSYAAPVNLGCEQTLRGLALSMQGQGYYVGGQDALKRELAAIVVTAGGDVKHSTRVESLISEEKRVVGVLLSSFEGIIQAGTVVISSRLRRLYNTLPAAVRDQAMARSLSRVLPSSWRFTLSLSVKREVIPLGATSSMAFIGSFRYPLVEENYLQIQIVPEALYPGVGEPDTAVLLLTGLVPYLASSMDYAYLRRLAGKMLHVLSEIMPFLEDNILDMYPDFRNSEQELRTAYPFSGPDWVPENLMQYYVRGHRSVQDFWGPSWTTPHPNLYFAGRCIWPALGIYGEALTARKIFDDVMLPRTS